MLRRRPEFVPILVLLAHLAAAALGPPDSTAVRSRAFDLAYNLDRAEATALLREALARNPDDASLHRAMAAILWLQILFQRGAVTVDHYLGSFSRTQIELKQPPPDLDAQFRSHIARAIALAEARVQASGQDPQAHYDLGAAVGLQASHTATVQGKLLAGFRAARRAYDEHERVLQLDPSRKDAGLVVGLYRYIVSTLSLPVRLMAYVAGFGGGRERGIQMLEEAAAYGGDSRTDAMFALILVYNRERRFEDALRVLRELRREYPRNRLVVLEIGSTALRAGRAAQAEASFTEGLAIVEREKRPLFPGEQRLWHYKRGAAQVALRRFEQARADLKIATAADAQSWVRGRAFLELARIAAATGDAAGVRSHTERAESLCSEGNDASCAQDARELRRSAGGR